MTKVKAKVVNPAQKRIQEIRLSKPQGKPKAVQSHSRLTRAKTRQLLAVEEADQNPDLNKVVEQDAQEIQIRNVHSQECWTQQEETLGQAGMDSALGFDELQEWMADGGPGESIRQAAITEFGGQPFQGRVRRSARISQQASPSKFQNPEQDLNENPDLGLGLISGSGSASENVEMKIESEQLLVTLDPPTTMINTCKTPPIISKDDSSEAEGQDSQVYEDQGAQTPRIVPHETIFIRTPQALNFDLNQKRDYSKSYFWLWEFGSYCTHKLATPATELEQGAREIITQALKIFNDCVKGFGQKKVGNGFQTFETVMNSKFFQCNTCCNFLSNKQKSLHLNRSVSCSSTPAHKLRYPKMNGLYLCLVCFQNDFEKLYDLIQHYLEAENYEQIRRLGYNTQSLLSYQQELYQKTLVFKVPIQLTVKTQPLTLQEQASDARFVLLMEKDDPILKFLEITTLRSIERRAESEPYAVSFCENQGHLVLTQNKDNFQKGVANPIGCQVILQAKRLTAFAEGLPISRKFYMPRSLVDTGCSYGVQISLPLNNRSKVQRYFEKFEDKSHRADLAFWMLELVSVAQDHGIILRHVWHPDNWLWVESDMYIGAVFLGAYGNRHMSTVERRWNDTLMCSKDASTDYQKRLVPQLEILNQLGDVVVFAMMLVGRHYDDWVTVEGVYESHHQLQKEIMFEETLTCTAAYDEALCRRQRSALAFLLQKSYDANQTAQALQSLFEGWEAMDPNNKQDRAKMTATEIQSYDLSASSTITLAHNARVTTIATLGRYRAFRENEQMFY